MNPVRLAAAAAVLALCTACPDAFGQRAVNQTGGAVDANPQVGSGGSNTFGAGFDPGSYGSYNTYNNNVITGNVTGGRQFRGAVGYRDPRSFGDRTATDQMDEFARRSSGATTGGTVIDYASNSNSTSYYGSGVAGSAPAGFVRTPATGGFVPPSRIGNFGGYGGTTGLDRPIDGRAGTGLQIDAGVSGGLGGYGSFGAYDSPLNRVFGDDASAVPTDPAGVRASRLLGEARRAGDATLGDDAGRALSPYTRLGREDRLTGIDRDALRALTEELVLDDAGRPVDPTRVDSLVRGQIDARTPGATQADDALAAGRAVDASVEARSAEGLRTAEDFDRAARPTGTLRPEDDPALRLADPAQQSAQYAELRQRLDRFKRDPYAQNLRPGNLDPAADPAGDDADAPLPGLGGMLPGLPDLPDLPDAPVDDAPATDLPDAGAAVPVPAGGSDASDPADPPVLIRSFADGVTSPALRQLLEQAEALLAEGKYVSAVTRFGAAEYLVPNQPMVSLGQATAELGAGYYRRAANDLRAAFDRSPELTMARVDVAGLVGEERASAVEADLRGLAQSDPRGEDPLFLLAFVSYGGGQYAQAATYLDLAQERSGDPFYGTVKRLWALDRRADNADDAPPATRPAFGK